MTLTRLRQQFERGQTTNLARSGFCNRASACRFCGLVRGQTTSTEGRVMNIQQLRRRLPLIIALLCFVIAFAQPAQRGTWIVLGILFLIVGLQWRTRERQPSKSPGV